MKKLAYVFITLFFYSIQSSATDLIVDPNVTPGSMPNYYSNVNAAINASVSGDRILIAEGSYATSAIAIDHSLEIMPMIAGDNVELYTQYYPLGGSVYTKIDINGVPGMNVKLSGIRCALVSINGAANMNIELHKIIRDNNGYSSTVISGAPGMKLSIDSSTLQNYDFNIYGEVNMKVNINSTACQGINLYAAPNFDLSIVASTCTQLQLNSSTADTANRARVTIINSQISGNILMQNFPACELICIHSYVLANIYFTYGSIVASNILGSVVIYDEPGGGNMADTINKILIVADTIGEQLLNNNDNYKLLIANNILTRLEINKWNYYAGNMNRIINNTFSQAWYNTQIQIGIPYLGVPSYNIDFSNNIFNFISGYNNYPNIYYSFNHYYGSYPNYGYNSNTNYFPDRTVPGVFKWTYNGFAISGTGSTPGNLQFINIPGSSTNTINAGNPAAEYTDIDLTRNDRGRLGGPYSILNYNPTNNPSNGKAFIYDLDIPTVLTPTSQPINIQAKAYHRN